jgi:copper transport protein
VRRFALAGALALAAVVKFYSVASAHVTLVSSQPAANSTLAAAPASVRLEFSEPVEPEVAHLSLVRADGRSVALSIANDPHDAHVLVAAPGDIGSGTVRVIWHVVSEDGHPVGGTFVFTVGNPTAPPSEAQALRAESVWGPSIVGAPVIPALLRGLGIGCLTALCGVLFLVAVFGARFEDRPMRLAIWLSIAAPIFLCGHLVAWAFNAAPDHRIDAGWLVSAFGTNVGRMELWRALLALPPLWALALARRPGLALVLSVLPILVSSAVGHSFAFDPAIAVPAKALHLFALAAWIGGLLWLVVRERNDAARFSRESRRVSTVALWAVVVLTASGIVQTLILIPSFGALRSNYGFVILAKVAGLIALIGFGAYHRFRVVPNLAHGNSARTTSFLSSLRAELAVLWLVILLGGLLGYVSPPAAANAQPTSSEIEP